MQTVSLRFLPCAHAPCYRRSAITEHEVARHAAHAGVTQAGVSLVVGYNTAYVSAEHAAMQSGLDTQPTQRRLEREADLEQDGVAAEEL